MRHVPSTSITLADVAERAGVSAMTVSRVVNGRAGVGESTRERVERAVQELGYRPNVLARGLKANRSSTLGLIIPDITNPYFPEIVRGAEDVALEADYTVFLSNATEDTRREAAALRTLEERRVDGVIACSPRLSTSELHALLRRHAAAVVINRPTPINVAGSIRLDHEHGMRAALKHLHVLGRYRIGVLAGPERSHAGRERVQGIRTAARELGLDVPTDRFLPVAPTVDGGASGTSELLERHPNLDALVCFNDLVAAGALQACAAIGRRVPDDVAVVGYDDIAFARMFHPALTTLHVPKYDIGVNAMRILLDRIEGRNRHAEVILRPELVVRASTDPTARTTFPTPA